MHKNLKINRYEHHEWSQFEVQFDSSQDILSYYLTNSSPIQVLAIRGQVLLSGNWPSPSYQIPYEPLMWLLLFQGEASNYNCNG